MIGKSFVVFMHTGVLSGFDPDPLELHEFNFFKPVILQ